MISNPLRDKSELEEFFLPVAVQEIKEHNIDLEDAKSKVIFAIELDAGQFGEFFRKIRRFMDLVSHEKDVLGDVILGFSTTDDKASLFKKYVYYALKFKEPEFESKLEQCKKRLAADGVKV